MKGRDTNALTVTAARPERIRTHLGQEEIKKERFELMKSLEAIKHLCESKQFTEKDMIDEIKSRIANDEILSAMWETGMRVATNDEQRKTVMYMILDCDKECREIFATYIYYMMQ